MRRTACFAAGAKLRAFERLKHAELRSYGETIIALDQPKIPLGIIFATDAQHRVFGTTENTMLRIGGENRSVNTVCSKQQRAVHGTTKAYDANRATSPPRPIRSINVSNSIGRFPIRDTAIDAAIDPSSAAA